MIPNGPRKGHSQTKPQPEGPKEISGQAKPHKNPAIKQQTSQAKVGSNTPKYHQTRPSGHHLNKPIRKHSGQRRPQTKAIMPQKSKKTRNPPCYWRPPRPGPQYHLPGQPIPGPKVLSLWHPAVQKQFPKPIYLHPYKPIQHAGSHKHCGSQPGKKHPLHPHRPCRKPALKPKPGFQHHCSGLLLPTQPGKVPTNLNPTTSKTNLRTNFSDHQSFYNHSICSN